MYLFGVVIITVATRLNTILWLLCRFLNISFLVKILFILYILNSKIYKIKKYGKIGRASCRERVFGYV